ncbi:MAG: hypothetical protein GTO62_14335 [Planctomycetales bacterium]|nr:hypothetical protein [Planctomycetales bacterium]NIP70405.1 hypothetical protein [Planctomycetales bacterium]
MKRFLMTMLALGAISWMGASPTAAEAGDFHRGGGYRHGGGGYRHGYGGYHPWHHRGGYYPYWHHHRRWSSYRGCGYYRHSYHRPRSYISFGFGF